MEENGEIQWTGSRNVLGRAKEFLPGTGRDGRMRLGQFSSVQ